VIYFLIALAASG